MASPTVTIPSNSMFPLPSKSSQDANINTSGTSSSSSLTTPPELEQTLQMLSSHRTVLGYLLLSRSTPVRIIRYSGVVFDGEQGRRYARAIGKIVEAVRSGLEEISGDGDGDEARFMRIRTKRHELLISPSDQFLLAVLHDPTS